jgi:Putative beta-lactamase-inhibitor-like, PepSY-like
MNRLSSLLAIASCLTASSVFSQHIPAGKVPAVVKSALMAKCPDAKSVTWEKEKGNFEANWGGASKEDNSVLFTPSGDFVETVVAMPVASLPATVTAYIKKHYATSKTTEAGRITWPGGKTGYEAEVKGRDLVFDERGDLIRID